MTYYLIRHGKTDASDFDRAKYGAQGAPLNDIGILQAERLSNDLTKHGIIPADTEVASSELLRAVQTAQQAGFVHINTNALLNEINTGDIQTTIDLLLEGKVPNLALERAEAILSSPPKEKVWVTHGLVIAAVKYALGMTEGGLEPENCEIVEINL